MLRKEKKAEEAAAGQVFRKEIKDSNTLSSKQKQHLLKMKKIDTKRSGVFLILILAPSSILEDATRKIFTVAGFS